MEKVYDQLATYRRVFRALLFDEMLNTGSNLKSVDVRFRIHLPDC
jgi:hypothetical protein